MARHRGLWCCLCREAKMGRVLELMQSCRECRFLFCGSWQNVQEDALLSNDRRYDIQ